ncbi:hypothetical protein D9550_26260 [Escherichia coli]|nr:hypothetical protein [Escherichia coli]EEW3673948.1 hypothetical protein [Escherichia coli]OTE60272.1 hypothetical protein AW121_27670 [Escherichia coli]
MRTITTREQLLVNGKVRERIATHIVTGAHGYETLCTSGYNLQYNKERGHCCKVSDEAAFCLIQRPYISKTLLTRRISPRGSP